MVLDEFKQLEVKKLDKRYDSNMRGIGSLAKNTNFVIRPADKGGSIVVLDKQEYIMEMEHVLSYLLLINSHGNGGQFHSQLCQYFHGLLGISS